uniref:Protein IQ-DOMAIN 31 n=1 Tax=Anthurium amnicola TaxID=1678845 RepID=A0A1D1Y278_9ARAE
MGRASKWLRTFLTGKKEKDREKKDDGDKDQSSNRAAAAPPPNEDKSGPISATPPQQREKRRWSFRRSPGGGGKDLNSPAQEESSEMEQKRHAMAVAAATAAAAGAAVAAAQAVAAVIRLTAVAPGRSSAIEEAAATKIQSVFRGYLARKALRALKGLVKLQALVRGHLVRKQAKATLRCMQALVTAQARARAQRIRMVVEEAHTSLQRQSTHRRSPLDPRFRQSYEMDRNLEEDIKIVEMDLGESKGSSMSRNSYSIAQNERSDHRLSSYYGGSHAHPIPDLHQQVSPAPSALTEMSPRACSGHFEEFSFTTAQSSPHFLTVVPRPELTKAPFGTPQQEYAHSISNDYPLFPNYMANTESSRAKSRSQSAPKQRPDTCERQPSKRRPSIEGRNIPRGVRMQRSSSHIGSAVSGYQYPWFMKLDRSSVSLKESECGSTSTVLTNTNYCRSLAAYEIYGNKN